MTLTVTMRRLLVRAAQNQSGSVSVISGYITGRKKPSYGRRESNAALRLVHAGLFEFLGSHRGIQHLTGGFSADHSYDKSYRITEAGRREIGR